MTNPAVQSVIESVGIVPAISLASVHAALPLADALLGGGLPIIEITFRTAVAAEALRQLSAERPGMLVGAGTVLTREQVRAAVEAGARFALAPGLNPDIVKCAQDAGLFFVPGVATPSEVEQGLALGCRLLKYFPAENLGGVATLTAWAGPYGHTGVRFVPTGGVKFENLAPYLACPIVAAVGGTWMARKEDISAGRWEQIRRHSEQATTAVRQLRESVAAR